MVSVRFLIKGTRYGTNNTASNYERLDVIVTSEIKQHTRRTSCLDSFQVRLKLTELQLNTSVLSETIISGAEMKSRCVWRPAVLLLFQWGELQRELTGRL